MVRDHYEKLGFEQIEETSSGETVWSMDTVTEIREAVPMLVQRDA
jgi:N-acetylglutamate synthase-like GNAT family acetyltransferase